MTMVSRRHAIAGASALWAAGKAPAFAQTQKLKVGLINNAADLPYFIGLDEGMFKAEGLDVELVNFKSATEMMAPLGNGDLDVGGGGPTAALYNAQARGLLVKAVADKASVRGIYSPLTILIRSELVKSGAYKTFSDLKGRNFGSISPGGGGELLVHKVMQKGGLTYDDAKVTFLAPPQLFTAMQNGALDATMETEPFGTVLVGTGAAVELVKCGDVYPDMQVAAIYYGKTLLENRALGQKFMNAYIRASRFYNDGLKDGKFAGPTGEKIIAMMAKYTGQTDMKLIRDALPHGLNPDGKLLMTGILSDFEWFKTRGYITVPMKAEDALDNSFAETAAAALGAYKAGH